MKKLIALTGMVLSLNAAATIPTMPNVDWDVLEAKAQTVALEKAQTFSGDENVKVRKTGSGLLSTNYLATSGECSFTVKVGFAFRTAVTDVKNCN